MVQLILRSSIIERAVKQYVQREYEISGSHFNVLLTLPVHTLEKYGLNRRDALNIASASEALVFGMTGIKVKKKLKKKLKKKKKTT